MNQQAIVSDSARKVAPVYLVWDGELMLDAPVSAAWPHVINYPSWQNYSTVQHVSGPRGGDGEVVLLFKEEHGFKFPPYYAITIKLEPERRVIWKIYPEKGTQEIDFFGIVQFRVFPVGDRTRFCYDTVYEFQVPHQDEAELAAFYQEQHKNFGALFAAVLPKLQQLVATGK